MRSYYKHCLTVILSLFISLFASLASAQDKDYFFSSDTPQVVSETRRLVIPEGLDVVSVSLIPKLEELANLEDVSNYILDGGNVSEIAFSWSVKTAGEVSYVLADVPLYLNSDSGFTFLKSYVIRATYVKAKPRRDSYKSGLIPTSILVVGNWHKYQVSKDGIYKLTYSKLVSDGVINSSVSSDQLKVYGNGFGMMSFENNDGRPLGIGYAPFKIIDGADGVFNAGDYILFYGSGPNNIEYDNSYKILKHKSNVYANSNYYYVGLDSTLYPGLPVSNLSSASAEEVQGAFKVSILDQDLVNLAKSGRKMYGKKIDNGASISTSLSVQGDLIPSDATKIYFEGAGRVVSGSYTVTVDANEGSAQFFGGSSGQYSKATIVRGVVTSNPSSSYSFTIKYAASGSDASAWIDQLCVNQLVKVDGDGDNEPYFLTKDLSTASTVVLPISNLTTHEVWEVSKPFLPKKYVINSGKIVVRSDTLQKIVVVDENANYPTPAHLGLVPNQNLHALSVDYVIVVQNGLRAQAERLANFHRSRGLTVEVLSPELIYNEFGSGAKDATAIKDLMRHLYYKWKSGEGIQPKYLLLFGDGSFVNKGSSLTNANFLPTYESENSVNLISSYVSDDYFAFLDENEGEGTSDLMDVAVGRFPVSTLADAKVLVDKVIDYTTQKGLQNDPNPGDWRNRITFVTDDQDGETNGDGVTHMLQADLLAVKVEQNHPNFYTKRIFLDAFKQQTTSGGERYPDANKAIKESVNDGSIFVNYTGHGGELGWAHERILDISTILSWDNYKRMPIMVTATCEFSRFDDPERISAGEYTILNPKGGVVALMTTNRVVYASENFRLNNYFYDYALPNPLSTEPLRLGDIFRLTKVAYAAAVGASSSNHMNFSLLGDPALEISYPKEQVVTTHLNGNPVDAVVDTLSALSLLSIDGEVHKTSGVLNNAFNGLVYIKIFDKPKSESTLANDGNSPFNYTDRSTVLYNGQASVENGKFNFELILPKDVSFEDSTAYINYYAVSDNSDANGNFDRFTVAASTVSSADDEGPLIDLFLNDFAFISGDITNDEPVLLANLFDDSGINTAGNGIGHDIMAIVDEKGATPFILNTYYKAALNTYKSGALQYQLPKLSAGVHTLTLRAWDVANNPSEKTISFVVQDPNSIIVQDFAVYPNPTAGAVSFKFTHNQAQNLKDAKIKVYDLSGREIASIYKNLEGDNSQNTLVSWDGKNNLGNNIKNGLYVYKFVLSDGNGNDLIKEGRISIIQ